MFLRLRDASGPLDYDLNLLATTAQGWANRTGPRVLIENPISERSAEVRGTLHWLERFRREGAWLEDRPVEQMPDVGSLLCALDPEVAGLVIFDPAVPASSNVAVSLAAREGLAVTGPDGLSWLVHRGIDPPVRHDLRGRFRGKADAHEWLIAHLVRGRSDLRLMSYVVDAFVRERGGDEDGMAVEGMDYVVANAGVAFDLSPWADEAPVDDPQQPLGTDQRLWHALFAAAAEARWGDGPLEVTGFPFWKDKYSNARAAGGRRRPVDTEWEAVWQMSPYGVYLNPLIGPNMSFHRWAPLPTGLRQPPPEPPPPLENKTYVCLHLGDFDGGHGVYRRLPALWADPRRGELPLGWGINPNMARSYPDIIAEVWATRTPNDHFQADATAAGYVNPNRLLDTPAGVAVRDSALTLWRRFCRHWYGRLDYTLSPMVLDQHLPRPEVLDALAEFSPEGAAYIIENRHGEEVPPLQAHLWNGMPVTRLDDLSYANESRDFVGWMLRYSRSDPTDQPAFHIFRFEWKPPSLIFDTFREAQRRAAPREWVLLPPREWFALLRRWLQQRG